MRGLGFSSRLSPRRRARPAARRQDDRRAVPLVDPAHAAAARRRRLPAPRLQRRQPVRRSVPRLFWWEGPDGSRLLTMYTAESYGTGLVPPADWPHQTWLALIHTGDNHGPPTPDEVKKLLAEAARTTARRQGPHRPALSDFADAILAEKPDLPVVRGDMPDTWIHGPMCDPQGASLARQIRPADRHGRVAEHAAAVVGRAAAARSRTRSRRLTSRACFTANTPGAAPTGGSTASTSRTTATPGRRNGRPGASSASSRPGRNTPRTSRTRRA